MNRNRRCVWFSGLPKLADCVLAGEVLEQRALFAAGALDTTFGNGGFVSFHPGNTSQAVLASSVAVQTNGMIVQAGVANNDLDVAVVRYTTAGTPDANFGTGGVVLTPITTGSGAPVVSQVLIDSQGRILVVGGDGANYEMLRFTPQGQLDSTFGTGGLVSMSLPGETGEIQRAGFDASGNIIVAGTNGLGFAKVFRFESNGTLDSSFGFGGVAYGQFPNVTVTDVESLLVEQDGSIVIGSNHGAFTPDWVLLRYTPAGLPDPTFGNAGSVTTNFAAANGENAYALAEQPDGKILVVGQGDPKSGFDIARYNADGSLDKAFGTAGIVVTQFAGDQVTAIGVAIDANGKIVVGGSLTPHPAPGVFFAVARYLGDGTLDTTFGTGGMTSTATSNQTDNSVLDTEMALDPSGNIVLASTGSNYYLARFTGDPSVPAAPSLSAAFASAEASATGSVPLVFTVTLSAASSQTVTVAYATADSSAVAALDYTAASGTLTFAPGTLSQAVTVQVSANIKPEANKSFVLNLSNPTNTVLLNDQYGGVILTNVAAPPQSGSPDFAFGWAGFAQSHPGTSAAVTATNVAVGPDGKIYQVGNATDAATGDSAFGLSRYSVNGSLDASFGSAGTVTTPVTSGQGQAAAGTVLIQPNGRVIAVGGDGTNVVVARYLVTGALDTSFGNGGIAVIALPAAAGSGGWTATRAALDSQGRIVVAGSGGTNTLSAFGFVIRLGTSGAQDMTFGVNGMANVKFSGGAAITAVDALLIEADQKIVVGGANGDTNWSIGRLTTAGTIDTSFGNQGLVLTSFGKAGEQVNGLAQQSNGLLLAIGAASAATTGGFDIARYTLTGTLDTNFNSTGMQTTFTGPGYSNGLNIAVEPNGNLIASGFTGTGGAVELALVQYKPMGALDSSFGSAGIALQTGHFNQFGTTMAIAPDNKIVIASGGQVVPGGAPFDFNVSRFNDNVGAGIYLASATQTAAATTTNMVFHATLSQLPTSTVTVQYQTADGTAVAGTDYVAQSGTLTFAAGTASQTITIAIQPNLFVEPTKSFTINLTNPSGAFLGQTPGVGNILNDNLPSWVNPSTADDVNADGIVAPLDALVIINYLNTTGPSKLGTVPSGAHEFYDVNGDGSVSSIDALIVINQLNASLAAAQPAVVDQAVPAAATDVGVAVVIGLAQSSGVAPAVRSSVAGQNISPAASIAPVSAGTGVSGTAEASAGRQNPAAVTATQQAIASQSGRRTTAFDPKTDVEDLLDLLV
jgi:uncharacterized delta-60 repeat protein